MQFFTKVPKLYVVRSLGFQKTAMEMKVSGIYKNLRQKNHHIANKFCHVDRLEESRSIWDTRNDVYAYWIIKFQTLFFRFTTKHKKGYLNLAEKLIQFVYAYDKEFFFFF